MQFSSDWTTRVNQLNNYVATQYAAMDTGELTMGQVIEYLEATILEVEGYEPEPRDVNVIRKAVAWIVMDSLESGDMSVLRNTMRRIRGEG